MTPFGRIALFLSMGLGCFICGYGFGMLRATRELIAQRRRDLEILKCMGQELQAIKIDTAFGFRAQRHAYKHEIRS